ncbi:MAG: serine protein kinase PrkA [Myxococcales bacterium]|nr:serine protein kinase PrkA [Myxococcales bacterium]
MGALFDDVRAGLEEERGHFSKDRRVLSFDEYLALVEGAPRRYTRDAARYLRDLFEHYGTAPIERPYGHFTRWRLFDLPWEDEAGRADALVHHEGLQAEVFRCLHTFARQGKVHRMVLLHGPNGSAKSTFCASIMRAMEHYARQDEGALYRFNWIFPRGRGTDNARIGFGPSARDFEGPRPGESYAHLEDAAIEAKLPCELRDHPLLLLPRALRLKLLARVYEGTGESAPELLTRGGLSHKSQMIFDALLSAYRGDLERVLGHVQVERWYISRRYRQGAVTLGPQMAADAKERQVTAPRSLSSLPPSLQNVSLFEPYGELVDAAGGLLEYSDLLKRPLEAWKYLLIMIETGEVSLNASNIAPNLVLMASSNEGHLDAFREHPEYPSFRGRLELARAGYLRDWHAERLIYDRQVVPGIARHVAPHATEMAALFAVLSRMKKPVSDRYPRPLGHLASELTPLEKADLFAEGRVPARLSDEQSKELRANIARLWHEYDHDAHYEGRTGASPREIRGVLGDAAQHPEYACLSPFAVLERLSDLSQRSAEFEWLRQESKTGGYHDPQQFLRLLRARLLDHGEEALRSATGLIDEARYQESFERYVMHVSAWLKGEKIFNRVTNRDEPADETMMRETEQNLGVAGAHDEFRKNLISQVAAWAIDHPGEGVPYATLFPQHLQKLKERYYGTRRKLVAGYTEALVRLIAEKGDGLDDEDQKRAARTLEALTDRSGYCPACARDMAVALLKERFSDIKR